MSENGRKILCEIIKILIMEENTQGHFTFLSSYKKCIFKTDTEDFHSHGSKMAVSLQTISLPMKYSPQARFCTDGFGLMFSGIARRKQLLST